MGSEADVSTGPSPEEIESLLEDLRGRANVLLSEMDRFRDHLQVIRHETSVEMAHFRSNVRSELNMLDRLAQQPAVQTSYHIARSSNLPFLETVWSAAKARKKLVALQKRILFPLPFAALPVEHADSKRAAQSKSQKGSCVVDAITDGGQNWIKLSLVTNTRLIFDLAKQGWQSGGSDSEEDNDHFDSSYDNDDIPLLRTVKELTLASTTIKIRSKHPEVTLLLPRVIEGETEQVDKILADCRATSAIVICGTLNPSIPALEDALHRLAPSSFASFSDVLNVDCTILLALVSEFSHANVSKEPWFHKALQRQVEIEGHENLLPSLLYPAMSSRPLICTNEAARRMREIVDQIGTASEKARTAILMGDDTTKTREELIQEMQQWSAYQVPSDWQLPIRPCDQNEGNCQANLPREALEVSSDMTAINKSIFLHGWATGRTTITSNRTVVKQIETDLNKYDNLDGAAWPEIWLCPTARSLVGKEKRGAAKKEAKNGNAWLLPDPLRREGQRRNGLDVLSLRQGEEVEDLRPNGYDYSDVLKAKNATRYNEVEVRHDDSHSK